MSSITERLEKINHALTARELAIMLSVSPISIYKLARTGRLPSLRLGTCVRFCGKSVAKWLRTKEVGVQ
jgi:excisionase family DNA binding protein